MSLESDAKNSNQNVHSSASAAPVEGTLSKGKVTKKRPSKAAPQSAASASASVIAKAKKSAQVQSVAKKTAVAKRASKGTEAHKQVPTVQKMGETLEQKLERFDAAVHGGELMPAAALPVEHSMQESGGAQNTSAVCVQQKVLVLIDADNISYQLAPSVMETIEPYWSNIDALMMASNSEGSGSAERWRKAVSKKNKYMHQVGVHCRAQSQQQYVCSGAQGADSELLYAMHEFVSVHAHKKEATDAGTSASRVLLICVSNDQDIKAYAQVLARKYQGVHVLSIGYAKDKMSRDQDGLLVSANEQGGACMVKERTDVPLIVQHLSAKSVHVEHDSLLPVKSVPHHAPAPLQIQEQTLESTAVVSTDGVERKDAFERAWKTLDIDKMHKAFDVLNPAQNKMLLEVLRGLAVHKRASDIGRLNLGPKLTSLKLSVGQKKALYAWFGRPENPLVLRLDERKVFDL